MGIMYQANSSSSFYPGALDGVTAVVMVDIIVAIIYYLTVLFAEIAILYNEDNKRKQLERAARSRGAGSKEEGGLGKSKAGSSGGGRLVDQASGEINIGRVETNTNPLFLNQSGKASALPAGGGSSLSAEALERQVEPPSEALWQVYRAEFLELQRSYASTQASLAAARKAAAAGAAEDGIDALAGAAGAGGGASASRLARPAKAKAEFRPISAAMPSAGARASAPTGASLKALRSPASGAV